MRTPTVQETIALLSALVHADEMVAYLGPSRPAQTEAFLADKTAFQTALNGVRPILAEYARMACLPVRRDGVGYDETKDVQTGGSGQK